MVKEQRALYRQWRPMTFDEVVGQDRIVDNLRHQVKETRINHAYLFSGIRGTGKTTLAKLFSRAVNCLDPQEGNPCNACEVCLGILEERLMDVIEMDAASHNSVDDIRELKDHVNYPPARARYKVYIIDEVHMLSKGAFNALLKTLEEPPAHAIFLLATTEPERIPDTIRSRCQIYALKRVAPEEIKQRLQIICQGLGIEVAESGLYTLVEKAEGSVRDAISALDMLLSGGDKHIDEERVQEILGLAPLRYYYEMTRAAYEGREALLYEKVHALYDSGKNLPSFIEGWLSFLRNLLLMGLESPLEELVIASNEERQTMRSFQQEIPRVFLLRMMQTLVDLLQQIRYATHERILIETALMQLSVVPKEGAYDALLERVERLENSREPSLYSAKMPSALTPVDEEKAESSPVPSKVVEPKEKPPAREDPDGGTPAVRTMGEGTWGDMIDRIQEEDSALYTLVMEAEPLAFEKGRLRLGFYDFAKFQYNLMLTASNQEALIRIGRKVLPDLADVELVLIKEKPNKRDLVGDVKAYFSSFEDKLSIKE